MTTGSAEDLAYWTALAHLPAWKNERANGLIALILDQRKLSFAEFFELDPGDWEKTFDLSPRECADLTEVGARLPELMALTDDLLQQGFDIVPLRSREYSRLLKKNLKRRHSPPVLYTKGNKRLLQESCAAVLGSEQASEPALEFAEAVAGRCARERRVVITGTGRGVEAAALEATLKHRGRGIVVLSQGILGFWAGFKEYQAQIIDGDVLVLSMFFPRLKESLELSLARNACIYGLSEEIYVAEACVQGGVTWSGAVDGLRNGRKVFVRKPGMGEKNVNEWLISKGAIPLGEDGSLVDEPASGRESPLKQLHFNDMRDHFEMSVRGYLSGLREPISAREIKDHLKLTLSTPQLVKVLRGLDFIEADKGAGGALLFRLRGMRSR